MSRLRPSRTGLVTHPLRVPLAYNTGPVPYARPKVIVRRRIDGPSMKSRIVGRGECLAESIIDMATEGVVLRRSDVLGTGRPVERRLSGCGGHRCERDRRCRETTSSQRETSMRAGSWLKRCLSSRFVLPACTHRYYLVVSRSSPDTTRESAV